MYLCVGPHFEGSLRTHLPAVPHEDAQLANNIQAPQPYLRRSHNKAKTRPYHDHTHLDTVPAPRRSNQLLDRANPSTDPNQGMRTYANPKRRPHTIEPEAATLSTYSFIPDSVSASIKFRCSTKNTITTGNIASVATAIN